ncbi:cysteine hydrolase [Roseomonas sp. PWR1]|uniref:Cysteine hydrolase n=1 Tax=Roseomonas nitratireducens TaxID=2820810 RepID=A0ABS4ATX4_9PROT|nr:isochorismatase family cysteine hydrolase [Neoroseomonas nitratireducens]MBP0464822.1 cysteine hydrolase [Neoroseomonas nitratireducens]
MAGWKTAWRSFYYAGAPEAADPVLAKGKVALLVIDVQNTYLARAADRASLPPLEQAREAAWDGFHDRMHGTVIPTIARLIGRFRADGNPVLFARIACLTPDGRDRSLSQKKPGWNNLFLPHDSDASQIAPALAPRHGEVVVTKTTDSALTGTNLRLILANMGITHVACTGIFTDQCVSSTVRSLADESFDVILVEDGCAAGTMELHLREIEILNRIYCEVMRADDLVRYLPA